jgi:hypothetical protein
MIDPAQTFKLYGPTGDIIMTGSMNAIMERLPDTHARNAALEDMLKIAADAVEAEERATEAREAAAQILSDGVTRLATRLDSFEKQRAQSAKRAEAERKAAADRRVQRYLDELPDPDEPDDADLYSFDRKERAAEDQDLEGVIPPAKDPTGAILKHDEGPQDPNEMGAVYDPEPHPEPGSRLCPPAPQVAQPVSISLNSEGV